MTLRQSLGHAREVLAAGGIERASLEGELLLRQSTGLSRVQLYLEPERQLSLEQKKTLQQLIKRRLGGEPTAYITGHREFYGLDFWVSPDVLIPRPESELLVEIAISLAKDRRSPVIADIGAGCGAIAISLALALPRAKIYATDVSAPAMEMTLANCWQHGVTDRVRLLGGDMLEPLPGPVDLIVANLPYVKQSEVASGGFEPLLALNGGRDGLEKIRQLCHQAGDKLRPEGYLLLEIGQGQKQAVAALLSRLYPGVRIEVTPDLGGIDRVITATLPRTPHI
jgi:release factor glutamine methyltransferase